METEDFIEEVLNSTNSIRKVSPNAKLFDAIQMRIEEQTANPKLLWLIAASVAILLTINAVLWNLKSSNPTNEIASLENSIHHSNQLY